MITLIYQFNHYCAALIIVSLCSSVQVLFSSMYSDVIFIVCDFLSNRPDHLSCHVKHVHSTERPFKCQVTVRLPLALLHNQNCFIGLSHSVHTMICLSVTAGLHVRLRHQRPSAFTHDTAWRQSHLQHLREDAECRLHHQPPQDPRSGRLHLPL